MKAECQHRGLRSYARLNKDQLIQFLNLNLSTNANAAPAHGEPSSQALVSVRRAEELRLRGYYIDFHFAGVVPLSFTCHLNRNKTRNTAHVRKGGTKESAVGSSWFAA